MDKKNSPPASLANECHEKQSCRKNGAEAVDPSAEVDFPGTIRPSLTELSEDEMGRHEMFHQAVKQFLTGSARKDHKALQNSLKRKPQYSNLLTSQELRFLLR